MALNRTNCATVHVGKKERKNKGKNKEKRKETQERLHSLLTNRRRTKDPKDIHSHENHHHYDYNIIFMAILIILLFLRACIISLSSSLQRKYQRACANCNKILC
jgi:hypothetical protein